MFLLISLLACNKKEDCPDCGTHGTCVDDQCMCDEGYTGEKCAEEKTPLFVYINSIKLQSYSNTNNGISWDEFSPYADPYVVVSLTDPALDIFTGNYFEDVPPNSVTTWNPFVKVSATSDVRITIYDYDSVGDDDVMFQWVLPAYKSGEGFPAEKILTVGATIVTLQLSYDH